MVGIFEAAGYAAMEKASELTPPYNPSEIMSRTNRINYHHNNYDGKRIADSILDDIGYAGERRFDRHDPADRIIQNKVRDKSNMSLYETLMFDYNRN